MREEFKFNLKMSLLCFASIIIGVYGQATCNKVLMNWSTVTTMLAATAGGIAVVIGLIRMEYEDFQKNHPKKKKE